MHNSNDDEPVLIGDAIVVVLSRVQDTQRSAQASAGEAGAAVIGSSPGHETTGVPGAGQNPAIGQEEPDP